MDEEAIAFIKTLPKKAVAVDGEDSWYCIAVLLPLTHW